MSIHQIVMAHPSKNLSFLGSNQQNSTLTTYTVTGASFGEEAFDRRIIVALGGANSTRTLTSVTIGGVTATINLQYTSSGDNNRVAVATALVPTGTSGNIVVTWSGSQTNLGIGWWRVTGLKSNNAFATVSNDVATGSPTLTLNTIPGGFVIYVFGASGSAGSTWGAATERFDLTNTRSVSGADILCTTTSTSITPNLNTGNSNRAVIGVSF